MQIVAYEIFNVGKRLAWHRFFTQHVDIIYFKYNLTRCAQCKKPLFSGLPNLSSPTNSQPAAHLRLRTPPTTTICKPPCSTPKPFLFGLPSLSLSQPRPDPPQHICKRAPFAPAHKGCEPHPQPRPRVLFCLTRAAHESRHGSQSAQRSAQLFFTEGIKKKRTSSSPSPSRSSRTLHSLGRTSCSFR